MSDFIPYDEVEKKQILNILTKVADGRVLSKAEEQRYLEFTKKADQKAKAVTQAEISEHLDLAVPNVSKFLSKKGIKKPYSLDEIRKVYIHHLREMAAGHQRGESQIDLDKERALLAREQRLRTEQDRLTKAGELLNRESVLRMWSGIISELRSKILNTDLTDEMKANLIDDLREIPTEKYAD